MTAFDPFLVAWFGFTSLMAFVLFGYDKLKAGGSSDRVPERHLLVVSAMGGWPGGLLGMMLFRHKTAKVAFQLKFAAAFVVWALLVYSCWMARREAVAQAMEIRTSSAAPSGSLRDAVARRSV